MADAAEFRAAEEAWSELRHSLPLSPTDAAVLDEHRPWAGLDDVLCTGCCGATWVRCRAVRRIVIRDSRIEPEGDRG